MTISLFGIGNTENFYGFSILEFENTHNEDSRTRALFGFTYDKEDKILYVDLFWKILEFKN